MLVRCLSQSVIVCVGVRRQRECGKAKGTHVDYFFSLAHGPLPDTAPPRVARGHMRLQLQTAVEHLNLFERTPEQWAADIRAKQILIEKHKGDVALFDDIVCRHSEVFLFSLTVFLVLPLIVKYQ